MEILDLSEDLIRQYIDARQSYVALEQAKLKAAEYRGGMIWKEVSGRDYLVRTTTRGTQTGLGVRSADTESIHLKFTSGKLRAEEMRAGLKAAVTKHTRLNRALRVGRTPNIIIDILQSLNESGLADKFTVVGTNAIYAYETAAAARIEEDHLATRDVDFLWDNRKKLSLAVQEGPLSNGMIGFLKKIDPSFVIRDDQKYTAVNKYGYEVDIIRRMGQGSTDDPARITSTDEDFWVVKARNSDWLLSAPKFSEIVVGVNGQIARMNTVDPRAFVLFKLWMSQRPDRERGKAIRDKSQARIVLELINSRLPQFSFEDIKIFPSTVNEMLEKDSNGDLSIA